MNQLRLIYVPIVNDDHACPARVAKRCAMRFTPNGDLKCFYCGNTL